MKKVLVDYRIDNIEKDSLIQLGYEVIPVPPNKHLYEAVCGHPDMLLHIINKEKIIVHKDMKKEFIDVLRRLKYTILLSDKSLMTNYPYNIALNAVTLNNFFFHNLKYTDNVLLQYVKQKKIKSVKQGYTKCSTAIISENAIITSDNGIAECAKEEDIDVLLLPPGDILLPGLDYGFIGGCCGLLQDGVLAFYGSLKYYTYRIEVLSFLKKHKVEPIFLRDGKLVDRGSIFTI